MLKSALRLIVAAAVAAAGGYAGLRLAIYADQDDAPGGMVIGVAMMFGSLAIGAWIALRRAHNPSSDGPS